ncbi:MAG: hypothetical protein MUF12_00270 [Sediminibacterium sp.]|jgi:hypothetical protein|nr:hypothetical protein [Hydrotalea sp.]MCU0336270.1 hypothetical protein [Sediminibacterium sp.]
MKKTILAIGLFLASFAVVTAQKTEQVVSEKMKVVFPVKPEKQEMPNGGNMYQAKSADGNTSYIAMSLDLSGMGLTAEVVESMGDMLFEQVKMGMSSQMGGAEISKDEVVTFKGKKALYIEVDGKNATGEEIKGKKAFMYIFFIGAQMHQVGFRSNKATASKDDEKEFLDSVTIKD